jgi:hypothetical protein
MDLSVRRASEFFRGTSIEEKLRPLMVVGLDYLHLNQALSTLSGGELQRMKIASYLQPYTSPVGEGGQRGVFVIDEPTDGLHLKDVHHLIELFNKMVDEGNTAWHCSNWHGNCRTIGIEVCNTDLKSLDISDKSFETLCRLVADIAKRNGFGRLEYLPDGDGTGITGHKDWVGAYTDCPGKLYPRLAEICQRANEINYPTKPTWVPMEEPREMITKQGANLYELPSMKIIKTYDAGEHIPFGTKTTFRQCLYLRSDYSTANNFDRGIPYEQLDEVPKPEPQPEPTPDDGDDTPNWFIRFIRALGEFLINLFTRKEK